MKIVLQTILTILFLPLLLIIHAWRSSANLFKRLLTIVLIIIIYGSIWIGGIIQSAGFIYYHLYNFGIIDSVRGIRIQGSSMLPTLTNGSYVHLSSPRKYGLERGDIVSFSNLETGDVSYIKRIIGLPGEQVVIKNGYVIVNGKVLSEPYILNSLPTYGNTFIQECVGVGVPDEHFLVMGDNRTVSLDSRVLGYIKKTDIDGVIKSHIRTQYATINLLPVLSTDLIDTSDLQVEINALRNKHNVPPLTASSDLSGLAVRRSQIISNSLDQNNPIPDLGEFAKSQGYNSTKLHEFITFGFVTESDVITQMKESKNEREEFTSPEYYDYALGHILRTNGECSTPVYSLLMSLPQKPTYDQSLVDQWVAYKIADESLERTINSLPTDNGKEATFIKNLQSLLVHRSEISSKIVQKMTDRLWLDTTDRADMERYTELLTGSNTILRQLVTSQVLGAIAPTPTSKKVRYRTQPTPVIHFQTAGLKSIENGVTLVMPKAEATTSGHAIATTAVFANNSENTVTIQPSRLQMNSPTDHTSSTQTITSFVLAPLEIRTMIIDFEQLEDFPYTFIYINTSGDTITLGTYH